MLIKQIYVIVENLSFSLITRHINLHHIMELRKQYPLVPISIVYQISACATELQRTYGLSHSICQVVFFRIILDFCLSHSYYNVLRILTINVLQCSDKILSELNKEVYPKRTCEKLLHCSSSLMCFMKCIDVFEALKHLIALYILKNYKKILLACSTLNFLSSN